MKAQRVQPASSIKVSYSGLRKAASVLELFKYNVPHKVHLENDLSYSNRVQLQQVPYFSDPADYLVYC